MKGILAPLFLFITFASYAQNDTLLKAKDGKDSVRIIYRKSKIHKEINYSKNGRVSSIVYRNKYEDLALVYWFYEDGQRQEKVRYDYLFKKYRHKNWDENGRLTSRYSYFMDVILRHH